MDTIFYFSLLLSVSCCTMKFLKVMVDLFGCADDTIGIFGYQDINMSDATRTPVSGSTSSNDNMAHKLKYRKISNGSANSETSGSSDGNDGDNEDNEDNDDDQTNSAEASYSCSTPQSSPRHRVSLIDDSDSSSEDEDEDEDELSSDEICQDGENSAVQNDTNLQKQKLNGRSLKISRRATWKKHRLLMIPEEADENEEWSEHEF